MSKITINAAKKAEIDARLDTLAQANGEALEARQRETKKEELTALLKGIDTPEAEAIRKITELIS